MATATKAKAAKGGLTAYCMKTKEKNVPIQDAVIDLVGNKYIAKGHDGNGNKLTSILSKDKAEAALADGSAKHGNGFAKTAAKKK